MFRKFLLLATAVLACTACQTEDEPFSYDQVGYTGTLTVRALAGDTHYEFSDRNFDLTQDSDGKIVLWMYDTQFVPMMPRMTMVVPGLAVEGSSPRFALRGDAIIPYYRDGEDLLPMDASRRIDDFEAELDTQDGSLAVTFVCMGFRVGYAGTQIK